MTYLITVLLVLMAFGLALVLVKKANLPDDNAAAYHKIGTLLSPAERSLLGVLEKALGSGYRIFSKIRLADVVKVKDGLPRGAGRRALTSISADYVDFLICASDDLSIRGAIELDERRPDTRQDDRRNPFVAKVLEKCRIPLLRLPRRATYSITEIKRLLEGSGIAGADSAQDLPLKAEGRAENIGESINAKKAAADETAPSIELEVRAVCPRCGADLIEKVAAKGRYAGQKYLGCTNFPHCRYAEMIPKRGI